MTKAAVEPASTKNPWWLVLSVVAILAALPAHSRQQTKPPQEEPVETDRSAAAALSGAQEAIEREDYSTAVTILENFLFEHPGHVGALFNLAYCYSLQGRTHEAIDLYRQTLEVDPKLVSAHLNLGLLLLNKDKPAEAAAEFKQVVRLRPEDYNPRLYYAGALQRAGREDAALEQYLRAAELSPEALEPRQAALSILAQQEKWEKAEGILDELLALAPTDPDLLLLRAERLLAKGCSEEALAAYQKYFPVAEKESVPPARLGEMHLQVGRLARSLNKGEEALRHFEAARQQGGEDYSLVSLREEAETLTWLQRYQEAIPLYEQALAAAPDDLELLAGSGLVYLQTKQYPKAVPVLARLLQLDPKREDSYNQLASALYLNGNLAATIEVLDRRAAHAEETPGTLFLRAISYDKLNQCGPALTYYEKFLARNRDTQSDQYFQATGRLRLLKKTCRDRR